MLIQKLPAMNIEVGKSTKIFFDAETVDFPRPNILGLSKDQKEDLVRQTFVRHFLQLLLQTFQEFLRQCGLGEQK